MIRTYGRYNFSKSRDDLVRLLLQAFKKKKKREKKPGKFKNREKNSLTDSTFLENSLTIKETKNSRFCMFLLGR